MELKVLLTIIDSYRLRLNLSKAFFNDEPILKARGGQILLMSISLL